MKKNPSKLHLARLPVLVVSILIVLLIAFCTALVYRHFIGSEISEKSSDWADFGTFYGGLVGPVISLFAFLGLVATLWMQAHQISELEHASARTQLEQNVTGLLGTLSAIVEGTAIKQAGVVATGTKSFRNLFIRFRAEYELRRAQQPTDPNTDAIDAYHDFYSGHGSFIGHYFRTVYTIVKTIDHQATTPEEARRLMSWLTCRLSRYELLLLHYNCASSFGSSKFRPLVEKYSLLEHMDVTRVLDFMHLQLFSREAYGDSRGEQS